MLLVIKSLLMLYFPFLTTNQVKKAYYLKAYKSLQKPTMVGGRSTCPATVTSEICCANLRHLHKKLILSMDLASIFLIFLFFFCIFAAFYSLFKPKDVEEIVSLYLSAKAGYLDFILERDKPR